MTIKLAKLYCTPLIIMILKNLVNNKTGKCFVQGERQKYEQICEEAFAKAKQVTALRNSEWLDSPWPNFFDSRDPMAAPDTSVTEDRLNHIGNLFSMIPEDGFKVHNGQWELVA